MRPLHRISVSGLVTAEAYNTDYIFTPEESNSSVK